MAMGTSASASTTLARFLATWAFIHAGIGLGLVGLQPGADVLPHVNIGDVDRHDREGRLRVQAAV